MKKILWKVLTLLVLSFTFLGCEKEITPNDKPDNEQTDNGGQGNTDPDPQPGPIDLGLSSVPEIINADQPCTIHFKPAPESELYGSTDELYMHIGLFADEDWEFVQAAWDENIEKCHLNKVEGEENHWTLEIGPTVREYFQSGETPLVKLAMVVRNATGDAQSRPDCFMDIQDDKYAYKPFEPVPVVKESLPADCLYGINCNKPANGDVTLVFSEKNKEGNHYDYCYLIGEATGWKRDHAYAMKRDEQKGCWWITLPADQIDPDKEYMFQYHVGKKDNSKHFRVTDPYTEVVYDGWNDKFIASTTYPNLPQFPEATKQLVSAFKVNRDTYNWQYPDFKIKDQNDLIIYELLLRDFTKTQDLNGALEKLDYLQKLGINAIELMPVQEFDGNESWGYNVTHYFALDKAYGDRNTYKKFIDECHKRGIAVILDVVYNHVTGNGPMAKLYYEGSKTTWDNPWFNVDAPHGFGVFHDWNHENMDVRDHIKRSLQYLLKEYHIDGCRFDLTKGFTQNSGKDDSYDQSRVDILKDYHNAITEIRPDAVMICEHFVDAENVELGKNGMKVWRKLNDEFRSICGGGNADLGRMRESYEPFGTYVSFMESHDEERVSLPWAGEKSTASARLKKAEEYTWGVCGTMTGWGNAAADGTIIPDIPLEKEKNLRVAKNVKFTTTDAFKIRSNNSWSENNYQNNMGAYGDSDFTLNIGQDYNMARGGDSKNFKVAVAGTYDVVFKLETATVWVMEPGKRPEEGGEVKPQPDPIQPGKTPQFSDSVLGQRMKRAALAASCFLTVPGPKMIWQFAELGYDKSIMFGGDRTAKKPALWEYYDNPDRRALYDTYAGLLSFRAQNDRFFDMDAKVETYLGGDCKTIYGSADGRNFMLIANFDRNPKSVTLDFKTSGRWRNWFNENEKYNGSSAQTTLQGSEFRLFVNF